LTLQRSVDIIREGGETTKIFQVNLERQTERETEIGRKIEMKTEKERKLSKVMKVAKR
jgi:hypothetical protein